MNNIKRIYTMSLIQSLDNNGGLVDLREQGLAKQAPFACIPQAQFLDLSQNGSHKSLHRKQKQPMFKQTACKSQYENLHLALFDSFLSSS